MYSYFPNCQINQLLISHLNKLRLLPQTTEMFPMRGHDVVSRRCRVLKIRTKINTWFLCAQHRCDMHAAPKLKCTCYIDNHTIYNKNASTYSKIFIIYILVPLMYIMNSPTTVDSTSFPANIFFSSTVASFEYSASSPA